MMRDFAAIDFETANRHASSICSVGIVIVRDGVITDRLYSLVRPYPNYFSLWTTQIHGLTKVDTEYADTFPEVWSRISDKIEGLPLVAHNKRFDEGCLKAVFEKYNMDYPNYDFHCTLVASRRHLRLRNYRLNTVAEACGYDLTQHHHALADAEAAGIICVKLCRNFGEESMFGK